MKAKVKCMKIVLGIGLISISFVANGKDYYKYEDAIVDPQSVTFLNLSGDVKADSYDYSMFHCLESIVMSNCELDSIPESLRKLEAVVNYDFSYNNKLGAQDLRPFFNACSNLETLNLKGCDLLSIPKEIGKLSKLEKLNLSYNLLREVPESLKNDTLIEELDLAGNGLKELPFKLNEFKTLKSVDLSYNEELNLKTGLSSGIILDYLNLEGVDSVPSAVFNGDLEELLITPKGFQKNGTVKRGVVENLKMKGGGYEAYNFACNSIDKSKVKKTSFESDELKRVPVQVYTSSGKELKIESKNILSIGTGMNQMSNLERLTIAAPKVNKLYNSIARLKKLKYLDIEKTDLSIAEIQKIHKAFPGIEINYNRDLGAAILLDKEVQKKRKIIPPVKEYVKEGKKKVVDVQSGDVLIGDQGTLVKIYPNSFVNLDGSPVTEKVEVELVEFYDPVDVFFSGIPMAYDSAASVYPFYSGGMFSLNAKTTSGKEVKLNPASAIEVTMPKKEAEGLSFYYFDEEKGKWTNEDKKVREFEAEKKIDIVQLQQEERRKQLTDFNIGAFNTGIKSPVLKGANMIVKCFVDRDGDIKMNFRDDSYNGVFSKIRWVFRSNNSFTVPMDHMNKYTKQNWILEDVDQQALVEFLKPKLKKGKDSLRIEKRNWRYKTNKIIDIELVPNVSEDNFTIKMKGNSDSIQVKAYPNVVARNSRSVQRLQKRAYKKYKNSREDGDTLRAEIMKNYGKQIAKFEGDLEAWKERRDKLRNDSSRFENKFVAASFLAQDLIVDNQLSRTVPITQLGTYNCDAVRKELMTQGHALKLQLKDSIGRSLGVQNLSLMTTYGNGYVNFYNNEMAFFPEYKNAIIIPLETGEVAIYPSEKMNGLKNKQSAEIEMILVDPKKTTKEEVRKMLNL